MDAEAVVAPLSDRVREKLDSEKPIIVMNSKWMEIIGGAGTKAG